MKKHFQLFLFTLLLTVSFTYHACTPKVSDKVSDAKTEMPEVSKAEVLAEDPSIKLETERKKNHKAVSTPIA